MMRYSTIALAAALGFAPLTQAIEKATVSMELIELLGEFDTESLDEESLISAEKTSIESKVKTIKQAPNNNTKLQQSQQSASGGQ